jgi:hypothetical protein
MILLSDNDLVIKLAQCDLLQDTLGSLNSGAKGCFVLSSLPYSLRLKDPDKSIEKYVGSSQAYERICGFLEQCSVLNDAKVDFDLIDHMQQIDEVDPGEYVNERVSVARKQVSEKKYDKVLRSAFGDGRDEQHCTECLKSYMVDVIKLFTPKMD